MVGRVGKYMKDTKDGRSFKEVVKGLPHHPKANDWVKEHHRIMAASGDDKNRKKLEKEMIWRLVKEILNSKFGGDQAKNWSCV